MNEHTTNTPVDLEAPHFHDHATSHVKRGPLFVVVVASVVIHLIIGIICGIVVVVGKFVEPPKAEFVEPPTVVEQPMEKKEEVKKRTRATARVAPKRLITSKAPSTLVIPMPEIRTNVQGKIGGTGTSAIGTLDGEIGGDGFGSYFGNTNGLASDLIGVFYDLKQFKDGKQNRNMDLDAYKPVVSQFCKSWNTNLIEKYFKADRPLYLTHLWIPSAGVNSAAEAPKAFGVQDKCRPSQWIAHYKGRITAPESGKYRFWGCGDDVLIVRVDNRNVLDGSHQAWSPTGDKDRYEDSKGLSMGGTQVAAGKWINLSKGQTVPIEILIGERPGGDFLLHLWIEQKDKTYRKRPNGTPILPIFTVRELTAEEKSRVTAGGQAVADGPVFKAVK